jgi:quercetin dioxygenase-like cupin family protein
MNLIPFQTIDWTTIEKVVYKGDTGVANWQTIHYSGLRIRLVEYSKDYLTDHWCEKGHIVYCLSGEFETELSTGEKMIFSKDQSFIVSDKASSHPHVKSNNGAKLLIIDGDFLK